MPGMGLHAVACEEVGSVVVDVGVEGSLVVCLQLAFGAEEGHCMNLEGMGCRADCGRARSEAPREVEVSLGVQQSSSSCAVEGDGHLLVVEVVKALPVDLTRVEVVLQEECRWPRVPLQT
jgi:hypothetical protein